MTPDLWTVTDMGYPTPCWMWNGTRKNKWGHCAVWIGGQEFSAHRRMYEQEIGPIPEGLEIDHLCKNPPCVRPDHLEPVTHAENIHRSRLSKLDWETVGLIRAAEGTSREIAEQFGISQQTAWSVRTGKTWT